MSLFRRLPLLAVAALVSCAPEERVERRPNIVLLVMDTTAARHLALYGHPRSTSPRLEGIAAAGALFENAFSTSTWTLPSHASLFTGLPPSSHGATSETTALDPSLTTLAAHLSAAGYRTLGFSNNSWVGPGTGLHRGFDQFTSLTRRKERPDYLVHVLKKTADGYTENRKRVPKEAEHRDFGATATNLRIRHLLTATRDDRRPLFLFVNYLEPHHPYDPPEEQALPYLPAGASYADARAVPCDPVAQEKGQISLSPRQFALLHGLYDGEIRNLDARIGDLFDFLAAEGLLDHALFIVTADHGEQVGEHGRLGHEANHHLNLYDDLLRVPLVVHAPFLYPPGTRLAHPVHLPDIFATCLAFGAPDLAAAALPPGAQELPRPDSAADPTRLLVAEYHRPLERLKAAPVPPPGIDLDKIDATVHAVRQGDWKLIQAAGGARLLFNVADDPAESVDLAAARPEIADRMGQTLKRWLAAALALRPAAGATVELSEEAREALRELGYVR